MNMKKCDRCGQFYRPDTRRLVRVVVRGLDMVVWLDDIGSGSQKTDVCPACMDEFVVWWNSKAVMQEESRE